MPLIKSKSKQALSKNIATEMEAHPGKERRAQNIAIAYNVQRKAKKAKGGNIRITDDSGESAHYGSKSKRERFEGGGGVMTGNGTPTDPYTPSGSTPSPTPMDEALKSTRNAFGNKKAHGGMIDDDDAAEHYSSIADAILAKKRASSDMVDLDEHSEEHPNQYLGEDMDTANEPQYDDSQISAQPEDSNEHGDEIDSDEHDMVSKIRSKIRAKRGM